MNGSLETRDLRLVKAIAEAGGATRAAHQLRLSQSAISHQLRGLEERLGVELFRRAGRKLMITAAGQRLMDVGHQVLAPLLELELELKRGLRQERPKLRVGTQCYTAYHWLPHVVTELMAAHPEVELLLEGDTVADSCAALREDKLDLVLSVLPTGSNRYAQVQLFRDELVLAVPCGHALAAKKYVTGQDLLDQTLILATTSTIERERVQKILFQNGSRVKRVLRLTSTEAALQLVQAGMGVSIQPAFTLRQRVQDGQLQTVQLTSRGLPRQWAGVFRKTSKVSAPIQTMLEALKRYAESTWSDAGSKRSARARRTNSAPREPAPDTNARHDERIRNRVR